MSYARAGLGGLDYFPCSYGTSPLVFRGPQRSLGAPYCAALGSTETFGKFLTHPFPALLESRSGFRVVNFGSVNAGLDTLLDDPTVIEAAAGARSVILQVLPAQNLSNPFYRVHPRRNDRFIRPLPALERLYPEVDFTAFSFTGHLIGALQRCGPRRFARLRAVLQATWLERMATLMRRIARPLILLWLAPDAPQDDTDASDRPRPPLVTRAMLERAIPPNGACVEIRARRAQFAEPAPGMIHAPLERAAAAALPGPEAHERAAAALAELLTPHDLSHAGP